jgi:hypothetical protein
MEQIKKSHLAASLAITLGLAVAGIGEVCAASNTADKQNPMSELVSAVASRFNLNASDVQAVFDEQKTKMQADRKTKMAEMETKRQQEFSDRLAQAVSGGKLTQDQADKIKAKFVELESAKKDLGGKTGEERRIAIKEQADSLKQWAKDNGISEEYLWRGGQGRGIFGTASGVSGNTITLTSRQPNRDGAAGETVYTVDAGNAAIKKITKGTNDKPEESTIAVSDIAAGDKISVRGTVSDTTVAATEIIVGNMFGNLMGRRGSGFGGPDSGQE